MTSGYEDGTGFVIASFESLFGRDGGKFPETTDAENVA
jgi:hypothetical protein